MNFKLKLSFLGLACGFFLTQTIAETFYIDPNGDDVLGDGTASAPWATLHKARDAARLVPRPLTGNITIILKDGTYALSSTLDLTPADSGSAGYNVTYRAENPGHAIISGGSVVTGWSDSNNDGIWQANVVADANSRQLFVDSRRAPRARSVNGSGWSENGRTAYFSPHDLSTWTNPQDIELVFEFRWRQNRGGVASVSGSVATLESDFNAVSDQEPFGRISETNGPDWVENNLALLDAEDEWYLDIHNDVLYYKPRTGESVTGTNAVTVVLPELETLISGEGVEHTRFEGLTFANATWLYPNSSFGYVAAQAGVTLRSTDFVGAGAFEVMEATPGNVAFNNSKSIVFANNTFKNLGGAGLGFGPGTQNSIVFNNNFEDISASAIVIGSAQDHHPVGAITKDNLVDNNLVKDVAVEYRDNPAIISLWADGSVIINNTIENVPYSAVSIGWGWGRYDVEEFAFVSDNSGKAFSTPTVLKDTLVIDNFINGLMLVMHDGGGIYNLSYNLNSRVSGNVITGANDLNGAVYLDDGSRGFQVNNNVSYNNSGPRVNAHIKGGQYHVLQNNDWSGGSATFQSVSQAIVDAAGRKANPVERSVTGIRASLPPALPLPPGTVAATSGLVINKTATASTNNNLAGNAIDGLSDTFWFAGVGIRTASWEVDLGQTIELDHVGIAFGLINPDGSPRYIRDITFKVQGSSDAVTWQDLTVGTSGIADTTIVTALQAINDLLVRNPVQYRYVRIEVTDSNNQDFGILRVKVTGATLPDPLPGTNLAVGGTASQSSTGFGGVASRAIDGNTDGVFANGSVTHTNLSSQPYWDLDLGSVNQINAIRLWNRSDCCSDRLGDFYIFVSDAPFAGTTVTDLQNQSGVFQFHHPQIADSFEDATINRTGRYVRVQLGSASQALSLAEVEVYGEVAATSATNLAISGTATQSSTILGALASRAIDGNTDGVFANNSVTHTDLGSQSYWEVDLGAVKNIENIKIWNRTDCCSNRLSNFHVFVSDVAFTGSTVADSQSQSGVFDGHQTGTVATSTDITINRSGRFVRIQLSNTDATSGENVLSLAEVQVFGN